MKYLTLFLTYFLLLFVTSCTNPETKDCGPNSINCVDCEECFCDFYYEGEFCEKEIRDKFIGTWVGKDHKCQFGEQQEDGFEIVISKVTDVTKVKILAPTLLLNDSIVSDVDFLGYLNYNEFKTEGSITRFSFMMEVYYDREIDELKLFLDRNEDGDEFWEWCNCKLSRK